MVPHVCFVHVDTLTPFGWLVLSFRQHNPCQLREALERGGQAWYDLGLCDNNRPGLHFTMDFRVRRSSPAAGAELLTRFHSALTHLDSIF